MLFLQIIIADEVTANIDLQTDRLIQKLIRRRFASCTVITVAHRLLSIIDCHKIIVLDAGKLIEFGTPFELLQKPDGAFTHLVRQTGSRMSKKLISIATETFYGLQCQEVDDEETEEEVNHVGKTN